MSNVSVDKSPHTLRPKRVFWVDGEVQAAYLDMAIARGNGVEYVAPVGEAVFVIIDGEVPREQEFTIQELDVQNLYACRDACKLALPAVELAQSLLKDRANFEPTLDSLRMALAESSGQQLAGQIEIDGRIFRPAAWVQVGNELRIEKVAVCGDGKGGVVFKFFATTSGDSYLCHDGLWRDSGERAPYMPPREPGFVEYCGFDSIQDIVRLLNMKEEEKPYYRNRKGDAAT